MGKIKDSILLGILSGLIGTTCMDASNFILWRNKKTEGLLAHFAGSMIMRPNKLERGKNFILGQIFHMTVGSCLGVGMVQVLKKFGKDYHALKGGFFAMVTWGVLYNFGQKMGFYQVHPHLAKSGYMAIWHHLIYGLATSTAAVALADPTVFPDASKNARPRNDSRYIYSDTNYRTEDPETPVFYS